MALTRCPDHGTRDASDDFTCSKCGANWDYADGPGHPPYFPTPVPSITVVQHEPGHLRLLAQQLLNLADRMSAAEMAGGLVEISGSVRLEQLERNIFTLNAGLAVRLPK